MNKKKSEKWFWKRDIKLVTTETRKNYLVEEPICHTTIAIDEKKTLKYLNKPVCLGLSILELSKILMFEFGMIM